MADKKIRLLRADEIECRASITNHASLILKNKGFI